MLSSRNTFPILEIKAESDRQVTNELIPMITIPAAAIILYFLIFPSCFYCL